MQLQSASPPTTLFGMTGKDIEYIRMGAEMGLGEMDLNKVKIEQIQGLL
jgi:hypothetical protein